MKRLAMLGFWCNEYAPDGYPRPQALVGPWEPEARRAVIAYLRGGLELFAYEGTARCRFGCRRRLGNLDLSDGTWVWPQGLAHYVEKHDVQLPARFVARAVARGGKVVRVALPREQPGLFDDRPWLAWARVRGACDEPAAATGRRPRPGAPPRRATRPRTRPTRRR